MISEPRASSDPRTVGLRLQEARKARGLTQQDVADQLSLARTTVVAMEKGERAVQPPELIRLAGLYGRPVHELLRRRDPLVDFTVQFRSSLGQGGFDAPEVAAVIGELQRLSEDYLELEELRQAPLSRRYPPIYDVGNGVPMEQAALDTATAERNRLGLGDGPIPNLREVLENDVGLRIFALKLPPKVAALLGYTDRVGGCIAVNADHPAERQWWSLAHEYGHFLTRRYQADVMVLRAYRRIPESERFADAFARCFLMPPAGLSRRFNELKRSREGRVFPADLVELQHFSHTSFEAVVRSLEEGNLVKAGTYEELIDRGFKVREAQNILGLQPEAPATDPLPIRYKLLAGEALQAGQITQGQFARFVRLDHIEARELYDSLREHLTLSDEGAVGTIGLDLGEPLASPRG
jgi:Zn-dependent peptidase ImmA (M78 family)/transcriptional regulator with XRE-family HTH domain